MSILKKNIKKQFSEMLFLYNFKAFKKNLRFKKYNIGITKFIKNRKKYFTRKRKTSNIINYIYLYKWSKLYILKKQVYRFTQLQNLNTFSLISRVLSLSGPSYKPDSSCLLNFSEISKGVFFNLTLFKKTKYIFYKQLFINENIVISLSSNLTNNALSLGSVVFCHHIYKLTNNTYNIKSVNLYILLIHTLVRKTTNFIVSLRKLFILGVISHKFLN